MSVDHPSGDASKSRLESPLEASNDAWRRQKRTAKENHRRDHQAPQIASNSESNADNLGTDIEPICDDEPYPMIPAGRYLARCTRARTYVHPRLGSWKCELRFQLIDSGEIVFGFLHLGDGVQPSAGRGSRYRRAWIIASGEQPKKRQKLSRKAFQGKVFEVEIGDTTKNLEGKNHPIEERYSTVKDILCRKWP